MRIRVKTFLNESLRKKCERKKAQKFSQILTRKHLKLTSMKLRMMFGGREKDNNVCRYFLSQCLLFLYAVAMRNLERRGERERIQVRVTQ